MPPVDGKTLVLDAVDLVKLVGETVQLKRQGRRYVGLCPFHNEKSPSFGVDPAKQFFHCFGCKKGGNAIDFVIERDHIEFKTALQVLADWAGVELPRYGGNREQNDRRQALRDACSQAADLYRRLLGGAEGETARKYLLDRGFTHDTFERFGLGFAPDSWDTLARHDLAKKFGEDVLLEAGLIKQGDRGRYDAFRGRVIFPIRDEQGRPIAFGGRVLPGSDSPAKYLNSPETPLFSKGKTLFGLDVAKQAIVRSKAAVVFEGYADAAMAHQHGIDHAVAVLGTALTSEHAATLRRLAEKVILVFDADAAGQTATRRSLELFLHEPIEVAVAELPAGTDPDEFLQEHGETAFRDLLDNAVDALTFHWRQVVAGAGDSVTGRETAVRNYLDLLSEARRGAGGAGSIDNVRWGAILSRVSRLTGLSGEDLNRRFSLNRPQNRRRPTNAEPAPPPQSKAVKTAAERAEAELLGALFNDPALWQQVQPHVQPDAFSSRQHRFLGELFWDHLRNEGEPTFAEWLDVARGAVLSAGGDAAAAERARLACIELATAAEELGEPKEVARASVIALKKLREGAGVNELLQRARRTAGEGSSDDGERDLLRNLEAELRATGRAKPAAPAESDPNRRGRE